jgi:NNP family nitrate/nitrite transporter-like MFS transporter
LHSKLELEIFGIVVLGVSGAGFAVAMPLASRWYPPHLQGMALGITGAGTVGVPLCSLFVPWLAQNYGWQNVFGFLLVPSFLVFAYYLWAARDAPDRPAPVTLKNYSAVLRDADTWWFMLFYGITFGGFVGLGSTLPLYFTQWYHLSGITAGVLAAIVGFVGALTRPVGGILADRFGGIRTLQILFMVVGLAYVAVALLPEGPTPSLESHPSAHVGGWNIESMPGMAWLAVCAFFLGLMALGMGNGAVFQLVPLRFRNEIGVMTGLVGMAGGVGGFFLARALGLSQGATGGFLAGFSVFAGLAVIGFIGLLRVKTRWRTTWGAVSGARV